MSGWSSESEPLEDGFQDVLSYLVTRWLALALELQHVYHSSARFIRQVGS